MGKNEIAESRQLVYARSLALGAVKAAIAAANPRKLVRRAVVRRGNVVRICGLKKDISAFSRVLVLGAGKASLRS
jgi:glycerate-2-kinase